ncbi:endonuclease/exonuclease/phosphatase family protein [Paracoccus aerodenitrificans]|uniref:endonuclease/exonuclease/phosphatase family protein n=1 Tax=Paracoccus aerodenitrificans TaxID=3017781 RepID=UPI003369CEE5
MSLGWHGNAILACDGFDVEAMDRLDLPGLEPRGAVLARCAGLVVVGTHLGLMRSHRLQQMERIREVLANGQYETALIAGDFNEWSETNGFEPWKDGKRRSRPIDFALARCRGGMKRMTVGSSSGTTRRGPYASQPCWA